MKLNIGCGFRKLEGYVNVDKAPMTKPDQIVDLEQFPWPWPDNSVSEIFAFHCLEHLGADTAVWIRIIKEMWRVCRPDGIIKIAVPHPLHPDFFHDPTHVRVVTPTGLALFDQSRNMADFVGTGESKLGLEHGVDLDVAQVFFDFAEPWLGRLARGEMTLAQAIQDMNHQVSVCHQIRMVVRVVKPGRAQEWMKHFDANGVGKFQAPPDWT